MEFGIESFENFHEIIKTKGISAVFQDVDPFSFQIIRITNYILPLITDNFEEFPEECNLNFFKTIVHEIFVFSIKRILDQLQKMDSPTKRGEISDKTDILPQVLAKWWVSYLSNLSQAFNQKQAEWGTSLDLWFTPEEIEVLADSIACLEDYFHWKVVILQSLCIHRSMLKNAKISSFEENCEIIRKYQLARLEKELCSLEMSISQNEKKPKEDPNCKFRQNIFNSLLKIFDSPSKNLISSLLTGRFDKKNFPNLSHSLIIGEDGGFYAILNKLSEFECEILLETGEISNEYLKACKIKMPSSEKSKFIIGKGSFGLLRFCMALTRNETSTTLKPGQIICVKKTAYLGKNVGNEEATMPEIRENVWNDYSVGDIGRMIFSPAVYDMKIIESQKFEIEINEEDKNIEEKIIKEEEKKVDTMEEGKTGVEEEIPQDEQATKKKKPGKAKKKKSKQNENEIEEGEGKSKINTSARKEEKTIKEENKVAESANNFSHVKGYTMLQFVAVYDGSKVFLENSKFFNNWTHQKAYLIDIFTIVSKLLNKGICMTDLKPQNTLYDSNNYRGMLIDLGGVVRKKSREELQNCDVKYIHQYSPEYMPYEVLKCEEEDVIDLCKVPSYSLSVFLKELVLKYTSGVRSFHKDLDALYQSMRVLNPIKRISVEDALEKLKEIGKNEEKSESLDFGSFIKKLYEKTIMNLELFGMNPGLMSLMKHYYIDLKVSSLNPEMFPQFETKSELQSELSEFFSSEEKVFILLGASGSGKSTFLQKAYLTNLENWNEDEPIPIYMNLAAEEDLKSRWKWLVQEVDKQNEDLLNFTVFSGIVKYPVRLYIDSFDEVGSKINFIEKFFEDLGNNSRNKCLIACRTEFIQKESDFKKFFKPKEEGVGYFKRFILPLNRWEFNYENYIEKYYQNTEFEGKIEEIKRSIREKNLKAFMLTSNLLKMTLDVFPQIMADKKEVTRNRVFKKYVEFTISKVSPIYRDLLMKKFDLKKDAEFFGFISQAGSLLAETLFKANLNKINLEKGAVFFEKYMFDQNIPCLENPILIGVVRAMDLHIEVKGSIPLEKVSLGFLHDSIKTYYVTKSIVNETSKECYNLLGVRSLSKEESLIKFLAGFVQERTDFLLSLKKIIYKGKEINSHPVQLIKSSMFSEGDLSKSDQEIIRASSNAITILVAANVSFMGEDLSNIHIEGANLRDGCFINCDMTGADLTDCNLRSCKMDEVLLQGTCLKNIKLGLLPDINIGSGINSVEFSKDDAEILCGCVDKSVKIFDSFNGKLIRELSKNTDSVNFACYSPDFLLILTGSEDGYGVIFDKSSGDFLKKLSVGSPVTCGCFSPDSKRILLGSQDKKVRIWGKAGWDLIKTVDCHENCVTSLSFSNNGIYFMTSSRDQTMKIWDFAGKRLCKTFMGHKNWVNSACFSPDDNFILSGSQDNTLRLWDRNCGITINILEGHKDAVTSVSFSHNGLLLISGSIDCIIKLWDRNTGNLLQNFEGNTAEVTCVRFSSDDGLILSGSKNSIVKLFDRSLENKLKSYEGHNKSVNCVAISPSGKFFVSSSDDCTIKVWDMKNGKLMKILEGHYKAVTSVSISQNEDKIVSSSEDKQLILWDFKSNAQILTIKAHEQIVTFVCFSPLGDSLLSCSRDKTMRIWNAENGNLNGVFNRHTGWVNSAAFSNESPFIASASEDKSIIVWNSESGEHFRTILGHAAAVNSVVFTKDGQFLVSASDDKTVKLWTKNTGELVKSFEGHTKSVRSVTVYKNPLLAMSTSEDKSIMIWDISEKILLKTLKGHSNTVNSACFSPCGTIIISASSDNSVKKWEAKSGNLLNDQNFSRQTEISHDKTKILTTTNDFAINIWDKTSKKLITALNGHTKKVRFFIFSTKDNEILSASDDKTIKLWDSEEGKLLKNFEGDWVEITALSFSKNSDFFISGHKDGAVKLFEKSTGLVINWLNLEGKTINYVAFSDNDLVFLVKTMDKIIRFYETKSFIHIEDDKDLINKFLRDEIMQMQCKFTISSDETALNCKGMLMIEVNGLSLNEEKILIQRGGKMLKIENKSSIAKKAVKKVEIQCETKNPACICCKVF